MLECMAKTEEEEQQRAFRPSTQGRRARRGNEHQRVDLEALELQILDRFADGEPTAEAISGKIEAETYPFASDVELLDGETDAKNETAEQSENQLGALAKYAPMIVTMIMVVGAFVAMLEVGPVRSEEHTSELQSLMRISYAVFCLTKKNTQNI